MSFIPVFGNPPGPINPANTSLLALALDENVTLVWPIEQQDGTQSPVASIIDVTPTGPGFSITMPDARQTSTGTLVSFNNLGADAFTVLNASSGVIVSVAPGTAWSVYLAVNSSAAGTWRIFQFGAGTSSANAAALAGFGLKAITSTLNQAMAVVDKSSNYVLTETDRAQVIMWTGGIGTFTLPDAPTVGSDWFAVLKNLGSGSLTVDTGGETIDGAASLLMGVNDSCFITTDGVNFFTVGFGQSNASAFDFISLNVAGTGNYTLNAVEQNRIAYDLTGVLTGNRNIIVPASVQQYWVQNNTTGAFTVTVKTALGTGVTVPQGSAAILFCDGTDVINAADSSGVSFPITIGQGGTGQITAAAALAALGGVPTTRAVNTGAGLTGGGTLAGDLTLAVSLLGIQSLVDPNADRLMFWDDSLGAVDWLTLGTNLSITGTTLNASSSTAIVTSAAASLAAIAVGQSALVFKAADTSRNTTTTPTADPALQLVSLPVGKYEFEGFLSYFQNSAASQGLKFQFTSGFSAMNFHAYAGPDGSAPTTDWQAASRIQGAANVAYNHNMGASSATGSIGYKGAITVGATDTVSLDWSQETSNANNTTLLAGSWFKITRLS